MSPFVDLTVIFCNKFISERW